MPVAAELEQNVRQANHAENGQTTVRRDSSGPRRPRTVLIPSAPMTRNNWSDRHRRVQPADCGVPWLESSQSRTRKEPLLTAEGRGIAISTSPADVPSEWIHRHLHTLSGLDARDDLADLEPLRDIVGDARVVAIGEGAHFVREFSRMRERVLRFLAERCGFTVFAFEYSFVAADALDDWLHDRDTRPLAQVAPAAAEWGAGDLMTWLRNHNRTGHAPLRFVGVDLPEAGGALRPVLEPLTDFLAVADPDSEALARRAIDLSDTFLTGLGSGAAAAPAWAGLSAASQNELTSLLARLELRLSAVGPLMAERTSPQQLRRGQRLLAGARTTDYMFRAGNELFSGRGMAADMSIREKYMAETLIWQMREAEPDTRIVLAAHNNHIQKTSITSGEEVSALPMGRQLAEAFGTDYVSVALTHTDRTVPDMIPDPSAPVGFRLEDVPAAEPLPGSIEHLVEQNGFGVRATLTDLRQVPRNDRDVSVLDSIRTQSSLMRTDLADAFDAVISVPSVSRDTTVSF